MLVFYADTTDESRALGELDVVEVKLVRTRPSAFRHQATDAAPFEDGQQRFEAFAPDPLLLISSKRRCYHNKVDVRDSRKCLQALALLFPAHLMPMEFLGATGWHGNLALALVDIFRMLRVVECEKQDAADWFDALFSAMSFFPDAQATMVGTHGF